MKKCIDIFDIAIIDLINKKISFIYQNKIIIEKDKDSFEKCYLDIIDILKQKTNYDKIVNNKNFLIIYDKNISNKYKIYHILGVTYIGENNIRFIDSKKDLFNMFKQNSEIFKIDQKLDEDKIFKYIDINKLVTYILNSLFIAIFVYFFISLNMNKYNEQIKDIKLSSNILMEQEFKDVKYDIENIKKSTNNYIESIDILNKRIDNIDNKLINIENKINYIILQNVKNNHSTINKKEEKNIFEKYNKILDELEKGI